MLYIILYYFISYNKLCYFAKIFFSLLVKCNSRSMWNLREWNIKLDVPCQFMIHHTSWHITTHHDISLHIMAHHYTSWYITTPHGASLHLMAHHCTSWYITAHHGTSLHIMIHHYTSWYITTHHDTSLHLMAHHYTSWYIDRKSVV